MERQGTGETHRLDRLILWPEFSGAEWQLPVDSVPGERWLIGWTVLPPSVDGALPLLLERLLSVVVGRHATMTFASALSPPAARMLIPRRWLLDRHFAWTTAPRAADAPQRIFHADFFPWSEQRQVVVLSQSGTALHLTERHLHAQSDPGVLTELARAGAAGVLLPGVDGQVAGLYAFTPGFGRAVTEDLLGEARRAGVVGVVAGGDVFRESLRG